TPTLPNRSATEGMLQQAMWGIRGVRIDDRGVIDVEPASIDPEAPLEDTGMKSDPFGSFRVFLDSVAGRTLPVKTQLTGPVTLGFALTMHGVGADVAFRVAERAVIERAAALVATLREALPDAPLVVFLDEP